MGELHLIFTHLHLPHPADHAGFFVLHAHLHPHRQAVTTGGELTQEAMQMATRRLSTVRQLVERHPAFNEGGVRWAIFNEQTNGLAESGAILRVGRKVLIDEDRWFAWIDARNGVVSAA